MGKMTFDEYMDCLTRQRDALRIANAAPDLLAALKALTCWSHNGEQLCFRSHNGVPMGMSKKQERIAKAALKRAKGS